MEVSGRFGGASPGSHIWDRPIMFKRANAINVPPVTPRGIGGVANLAKDEG